MSYLNVPRIHFAGKFQADPSTVNNNDANFDPTVQLSEVAPDPTDPNNTSVYWNPNGTHNWEILDCTVRAAYNDQGSMAAAGDPIVGAKVLSSGPYPAKLVDLDPDNQGVSQIWGLEIQISISDPSDPTKVLASVTGAMPPTAFGDLWSRATNAPRPGMPTMCAAFQAVLTDVVWVNSQASPVLAALQQVSPNALSLKFYVDSYQPNSNQPNFTYGRIVGTLGPSFPNEAPRTTPRRLAPTIPAGAPIFSSYGPVGCAWDSKRNVLILDLANCIPTDGTPSVGGPTVPVDGWPIVATKMALTFGGSSVMGLKTGASVTAPVSIPLEFTNDTYLNHGGMVELPIPEDQVKLLLTTPLSLVNQANQQLIAQEDPQGRYVDVDLPFLRMDPGDSATVNLWATQFGGPLAGAVLDLSFVNNGANGTQWSVGIPAAALTLSSTNVTTNADGNAAVVLSASDPGTPRHYPDGQLGPDGQVYQVTGSWQQWGQIFLFAGAPINVLVFSGYPMPENPTWTQHVGPIFSNYARMYPYMKGIIDLSDYPTVVSEIGSIEYVLNLPRTDPHHMPVVRDLSQGKLGMINAWIKANTPE